MTLNPQPDSSGSAYGNINAVQSKLTMVRFSTTSNPTINDVNATMLRQSRLINTRLDSAGYDLPITDASALELLADVENLLTAAAILEELIIGLDPTPDRVGVADGWRKQADEILASIVAGQTKIGATKSGSAAGIQNATQVFSDADLTGFVDVYGGREYPLQS